MRCPTLAELPPAPAGKTGWPWMVETPQLPPARPDGRPWPRISIVTPSYNQGHFIEETIRSILLQGYPDLEYIIIDGGSTDESVEIIEKYELWLTYWVSEKDRGQAHAINKGFAFASGSIFGWLNSDDQLLPSAVLAVSSTFDRDQAWLVGRSIDIDADGDRVREWCPETIPSVAAWLSRLSRGVSYVLPQPSTFWRRFAWDACGPLDERLTYCFDHAFFLLLYDKYGPPMVLINSISLFRLHDRSKTLRAPVSFKREYAEVARINSRLSRSLFRYLIIVKTFRSQARFRLYEAQSGVAVLSDCGRLAVRSPLLVLDRMFWGAVVQGLRHGRAFRG